MKKNLILSMLVMTSLMLMVVSVSAVGPVEGAIIAGADRLVALQSDIDAGWDFDVTGLTAHSETYPSPKNLYGVTALGLIDAYELTENEDYSDAAENVANYLKGISRATDSTVRFQSFDYRFLVEFSALSGDNSYMEHGLSEWNWVKVNVASYYADGNQETIYNFWFTHTDPDSHGYAAWQAADAGLAALAMGDTSWANNMATVLVGHLDSITDSDINRFIGWGHALEFLNAVDATEYSTQITSLITKLADSQNVDGSWGTGENIEGVTQDTAYVVMGLDAVGETSTVQKGVNYLVSSQLENGGWGAVEYSETDSEAVQALSDFGDIDGPIFGDTIIEPTYPNCEDSLITINSEITDESGVAFAELSWRYDDGNENHNAPQFENGLWITKIYIEPEDEREITYYIKATDNVGNERLSSSIYEHLFTYDCLPPETTLTIGEPKYESPIFITSDTQITLTCTDTISGCKELHYTVKNEGDVIVLDKVVSNEEDSFFDVFTATEFSDNSDGSYTIHYYSVDNAGNPEESKTVEVSLDNTEPTTTIIPDGSDWTNNNVGFGLSCEDGIGSGCYETSYKIIDASATCNQEGLIIGLSGTVNCPDNNVCMKKVCYKSIDNLGNSEEIKTSHVFYIDKEKPTTTDDVVSSDWTNSDVNVTLTPLDGSGSGVVSTKYCVGDINCNPTIEGTSVLVTCADDNVCEQYVRYFSTDDVGNVEDVKTSFVIRIDKEKPSISNVDVNPKYEGSVYVAGTITASATVTDLNGVYSVTFSLGNVECYAEHVGDTWSCDIDTTTLDDIGYDLIVTAIDVAENENVDTSLNVIVDNTEPVTTIISPEESSLFAFDFEVNIEDSDDGSGLNECGYQVRVGGTGNWIITRDWTVRDCNSPITVTVGGGMDCNIEGEDMCKVNVRSTDNLGNSNWESPWNDRTFSIDWTNPPQILNSGPSGTVVNNWTMLHVETNKPATCRYDIVYKSSYDAMNYEMETTGGVYHSNRTELLDKSYAYYVLCEDNAGNEMIQTVIILFDVDTRANFTVTIPETKGDYLSEGWNQFFLPSFVLADTDLEPPYEVGKVLASINETYNIVYHYTGTEWRSYKPERPVNDFPEFPMNLTEFNGGGFPYFIHMDVAGQRIEIL